MPELFFIDSETRSPLDVTVVGAFKYAQHPDTECLIWSFAADDAACRVWSPEWAWAAEPEPQALLDHVRRGGYVVAWNAFFDRHIWNAVMVKKYGWPALRREQVLCAQAQAEANNLPGKLEKAAESLGTQYRKDTDGKRLIGLLCNGTRADYSLTENATPERMGHFRAYAVHDVLAMREIWQHTRPLSVEEWGDYHASEAINDRGAAVDVEFAAAAKAYATAEFSDINGRLAALTGDPDLTLSHHARKAQWLYETLWPSMDAQALVSKPPARKGNPIRLSADRGARDALYAWLAVPENADLFHGEHVARLIEFLELVEAGNSAAVNKFTAICAQAVNGRVHGQYSFNGGGQTGRFSSRGIQIHNLIRLALVKGNPDAAMDAIEAILAGVAPETLAATYKLPLSRVLGRLIRPTFIAPPGRMLIWADYDQIEGRALPWAAMSRRADSKLDLYRAGVDTYRVAAAGIFNRPAPEVSDTERQIGKVAELALQFGGAVGAFSAMSRNYGVSVAPELATQIVLAWRLNNPWARDFWDELNHAALSAFNAPGNWYYAGRVRYLFHPTLMRGTLICRLPSGRWLVYPQFKHEWTEYKTPEGESAHRWRSSFMKGFGSGSTRVDFWYGVQAENVAQGIAADFLRSALYTLQDIVVLHTHDELVCEVDESQVDETQSLIERAMLTEYEWSEGVPLSVTLNHGPYYTK